MNREEIKNKFYELISDELDEIYNSFEHITCDGCKYKDNKDSIHPLEPCSSCSRFYGDYWECKDE